MNTIKNNIPIILMLLFEIASAAAVGITFVPDGEPIADAGGGVALADPLLSRGLQYKNRGPIHDQEGVVVIKIVVKTAVAALTVGFQKRNQATERFFGSFAAFQRKADHVHAGQTRLAVSALGENRLIADAQTPFVDAHFSAPHPRRAGKQHAIGGTCLGDRDVSARDRAG